MKILNSKSGICIGNISGHISGILVHIVDPFIWLYTICEEMIVWPSLGITGEFCGLSGGEEGGTQEYPLKGESRDGAKQIICGCRCYCLPLGYFNMYGYIYKSRRWACVCGEELSPVLVSLLLTCLSCTNGEGLLGITSTRDLSLPPLNWVACSHRSFIYTYGFYKVFCI